ncbi:MAG: hypothetical protein HQ478_13765, partial [Chloroflexi bacterium]|nr:hypothetical protein [Chloroflexota bacterium]
MHSERVQRRIDDLLDQAEQAVSSRDWSAVRELANAVLAVDPENGDASSFMAMAERAAPAAAGATVPTGSDERQTETPEELFSSVTGAIPTSFANGRYEVKSLLGEGGKKRVYLAHDTTLDRDVAFGLIKAEGLDAESRQRITREAQAMARLGDHPNL